MKWVHVSVLKQAFVEPKNTFWIHFQKTSCYMAACVRLFVSHDKNPNKNYLFPQKIQCYQETTCLSMCNIKKFEIPILHLKHVTSCDKNVSASERVTGTNQIIFEFR